jgi:catechol 2,3-dioxygenase-like lactoylglutathione lyase family enzyme
VAEPVTDPPRPDDVAPTTPPRASVPGRGFDHVGLTVPDLGSAVDFFVSAFGARLAFSMDRSSEGEAMGAERLGVRPASRFSLAMIELGTSRLELLQWWPAPTDARPPHADLAGGAHVAVDVEDVARALERLRLVEGVEVVGEPLTFATGSTPGLTNAFVRTPWGALVELVNWNWSDV